MLFLKKPTLKQVLPPPVKAEHGEYSMILSARDKPERPTPRLIEVSLKAIEFAAQIDLGEIALRNEQAKTYANLWPGEHYRLLAGFMLALKPKLVIEIGTSTGLSALCFKQYLPPGGKIATFDIVPWSKVPSTLFSHDDLTDQKLVQHVADLGCAETMKKHASLFENAELIFIDAAHNGELEERIFANLKKIHYQHKVFILMDDIRVWSMLKMWRVISLPKIDLTSFGHWSGTGLVEFN